MMRIAVDFDQTWTADPELWRGFVLAARARGHEVWCITCREASQIETVIAALDGVIAASHILATAGAAKAETFRRRTGREIDVWIDDMPETIAPLERRPSGLIGCF